ncbi:MAG TPA: AbrB/MazE/SpoVT family DNA-binding domain-containing protein [Acidobacteriaceae bacterium]|jgi:AbrB family looped-hinge helix DNA binding protein
MQTKVSTKGQVVLPGPLRRKLGIQAGDAMDVSVEAGRIVLMPHRKKTRKARIVADPVTGLPVLCAGKDAPALSSREVAEILAEFP